MNSLDEIEAAIPALRRYARALVRDADAADDLVQDCLERAIRQRQFWRGGGPIEPWLFRILLNRFRDERRRYGRSLRVVGAESPIEPARPGNQEAHMALQEVHEAMGRLPEDQRAALLLVTIEGMNIAEAAAALSIKPDTLASRLARAREALRSMTGRSGDERSCEKKEAKRD